jgi:hypothetical protein
MEKSMSFSMPSILSGFRSQKSWKKTAGIREIRFEGGRRVKVIKLEVIKMEVIRLEESG